MEWVLIILGMYLCYYTSVYTKIVLEEKKIFASCFLIVLAICLLVLPFYIVLS